MSHLVYVTDADASEYIFQDKSASDYVCEVKNCL